MSTQNETLSADAAPPLSREEVIALVARAHLGSASADSELAGATLAAHSRLPKRVAENLGAGFGQWDFFPDIADIVDFAFAYVQPSTAEDLWGLARVWAADDAASRQTLMTLVGRDILEHELRRIDVPQLRELIGESRPARARELRMNLGLEVAPLTRSKASPGTKRAPAAAAGPIPTRMPRPERRTAAKVAPPPDVKRFQHPKFGEGVLLAQDGVGPDAKLTIKFQTGSKTLLARYVTELSPG